MLSSAHVLAMDAKNLLDVVDNIRIAYPHVSAHITRGGGAKPTGKSANARASLAHAQKTSGSQGSSEGSNPAVSSASDSSSSTASSAASSLEKKLIHH